MLLYFAHWTLDKEMYRGHGHIPVKETEVSCVVLCNCSTDAIDCLQYVLSQQTDWKFGFVITDGNVTLKRMKVDSRGFTPHYLMLRGMREPLYLTDIKSNALRAHKIFGV